MTQRIEGRPHPSGVHLQPALYVLQGMDLRGPPLPQRDNRGLGLVRVGNVDAYPSAGTETGGPSMAFFNGFGATYMVLATLAIAGMVLSWTRGNGLPAEEPAALRERK